MSDIEISSEVTMDAEDVRNEIAAMRTAVTDFKAWAEALNVKIPVTVDLSAATTAYEAFKKMVEGGLTIPIAAVVAGAPSGFGGGNLSQINQSFSQTFNTSSVSNSLSQTISTEFNTLIQNLDASVQSSIQQLFAQYNQTINQAGGQGGRGGGGFGNGLGRLGRIGTLGASIYEGVHVLEGLRRYSIESTEAGNDPRAMSMAELRLFNSSPVASLFLDPFGDNELAIRQGMRTADAQQDVGDMRYGLQQDVLHSTAQTAIASSFGEEKVKREADEQNRQELAALKKKKDTDVATIRSSFAERRKQRRADARAGGQISDATLVDTFAAMDATGSSASPSATERAEAALAAMDSADETQRKAEEANVEGQYKELAAQSDQRKADAVKIYHETQANRQASLSTLNVNSANSETREAELRAQGRVQEADAMAFARQRSNESARLQIEADTELDPVRKQQLLAQARAVAAKGNAEVTARTEQTVAHEGLLDFAASQRAGSITAGAAEELMRAGGNVGGAAVQRLKREDDERVALLEKQADALKNVNRAESERLHTLADAEKQASHDREKALDLAQTLHTQDAVTGINTTTAAMERRAHGQFVAADDLEAESAYNLRIQQLDRNDATKPQARALELEQTAARNLRAALRSENATRLNSQADIAGLHNDHRDPEARLAEINERHREELYNAGGDPQATAAINRKHREELRAFLHDNHPRVTSMSARDAYFAIQSSVLSDPTGNEGRSLLNARNKAQLEMQHMRPIWPPNKFLERNSGVHHGEQIGSTTNHAATSAAAASTAAVTEQFGRHVVRFGEYVEQALADLL